MPKPNLTSNPYPEIDMKLYDDDNSLAKNILNQKIFIDEILSMKENNEYESENDNDQSDLDTD